jgi:transposase
MPASRFFCEHLRQKVFFWAKRADIYLRTLLMHGARSVLTHSKTPPRCLTNLAQRRPKNVTVVALANKMARTIWALSAHGRTYQPGYVGQTRSA